MIRPKLIAFAATLAGSVFLAAACGKSSTTGPSSNLTCSTLPNATTFLILSNVVCPKTMTVARGSRVTFINGDNRFHDMNSDPHPEHTDCTELNQIGHLEPGQQRDSGNLNVARNCGFHDHNQDSNNNLKGTITIQ